MATITFDRLRQMSLNELAFRSRQEAFKLIDRLKEPASSDRAGRRRERASDVAWRRRSVRLCFPGITDTRVPELMQHRCPESTAQVVAAAERLMDGRIDLLGYRDLPLGSPIDWTRDLVSGRLAPETHWSRIDPLAPSAVGDSKVVWELNRHQWLVTLAQATRLTGDTRFARFGRDVFHDWRKRQPKGLGINWASSLEVALRLISWCWFAALLGDDVLNDADRLAIRESVHEHASYVERYLSTYFSPNTHLTGEALGLVYAGVMLGGRDGSRWRRLGADLLNAECQKQVSPDGVHVEQATCYQRYTAEIYMHYLLLSDWIQDPVPAQTRGAVQRMVDFLIAVSEAGRMPSIGDADGGWILPLTPRDPDDCRGVMALSAVYFDRPDHAGAAGELAPEVVWMFGRGGVDMFDGLERLRPIGTPSRVFADSGVAVMRSGWEPKATRVIFDVGPIWRGPCRAHGHADLLSVQLAAGGEEWLVDPGTYCYTPEPEWRRHFRGTGAHNTITIDGRGQAEPVGPFNWSANPKAELRAWASTLPSDYADADHAAFSTSERDVRHRRRVLFLKPNLVVVVDDLVGVQSHVVEARWQWAKPVREVAGQWFVASTAETAVWLKTFGPEGLGVRVAEGTVDPIEGWIAPHYGQRRPAPVVVARVEGTLPARLVTVLVVGEPGATPEASARVGCDGLINAIQFEDRAVLLEIGDIDVVARVG